MYISFKVSLIATITLLLLFCKYFSSLQTGKKYRLWWTIHKKPQIDLKPNASEVQQLTRKGNVSSKNYIWESLKQAQEKMDCLSWRRCKKIEGGRCSWFSVNDAVKECSLRIITKTANKIDACFVTSDAQLYQRWNNDLLF